MCDFIVDIKESQCKKRFCFLRWLLPLLSPISCNPIMFSNYLLMWQQPLAIPLSLLHRPARLLHASNNKLLHFVTFQARRIRELTVQCLFCETKIFIVNHGCLSARCHPRAALYVVRTKKPASRFIRRFFCKCPQGSSDHSAGVSWQCRHRGHA